MNVVSLCWSLAIAAALLTGGSSSAQPLDVWIGVEPSHEPLRNPPKGIYHATLDRQTGKLSPAELVGTIDAPGFLARHPRLPVLYSTGNEAGEAVVAAWQIDRSTGRVLLESLGVQPTGSGEACHVSVDQSSKVLLSAQYGGGSVVAYPLDEAGRIGPSTGIVQHQGGSGVVPDRQADPHPHWIGVSPDNRYALVPDLGQDRVRIYQLDTASARLTPFSDAGTARGGGPRHLAWHPNGRFAYVVEELLCGVSTFSWNAATGTLGWIDTQPMLTEAERAAETFTSGSEVAVHPSGRFLYAAVRGHDTISVFQINPQTGVLDPVEREPIRGSWPRHFGLSPDGAWLIAAGRDSDSLAVFAIDAKTGALRYTLNRTAAPRPICVIVR
ncbi:lactonase family protein [Botrimarina hoheduenensis]|uniref:6-phosphogluconolactonase n=1 Tax=Botrimarina hoheduenensis TaxID=2528000 RepID=A0A5C5W7N7_9BACT|nr:lactonase family protein [Botrimarina hoheduenensis]TWT46710.1 6-phosphogluconolactonase [Botrimarina hoheduenensis]